MHQLFLILDINSKFVKSLKENFLTILHCIRTSLGLQLSTDFHNIFTIYAIDSYDIYELYKNGESSSFNYLEEFQETIEKLKSIFIKKGFDDTWESKIVKCLSQIICKTNKISTSIIDTKIIFISSQQFQMNKDTYEKYLAICTYAAKKKIRLDYLQIDVQSQSEMKQDLLGIEGLKLGVQLTSGIVHKVEIDKTQTKMFAQMLFSAFHPGDQQGFVQAKIQDLQYKSFCACCNKVTQNIAYACSNCLTIQCDKQKQLTQCVNCKMIFHIEQ